MDRDVQSSLGQPCLHVLHRGIVFLEQVWVGPLGTNQDFAPAKENLNITPYLRKAHILARTSGVHILLLLWFFL